MKFNELGSLVETETHTRLWMSTGEPSRWLTNKESRIWQEHQDKVTRQIDDKYRNATLSLVEESFVRTLEILSVNKGTSLFYLFAEDKYERSGGIDQNLVGVYKEREEAMEAGRDYIHHNCWIIEVRDSFPIKVWYVHRSLTTQTESKNC